MKSLVACLLVFPLLTSCLSGSRAPVIGESTASAKEKALREKVAVIAEAISQEDYRRLAEVFSSVFTVDPSVAVRFVPESTGGEPEQFFTTFFNQYENVELSLSPSSLEISGEVGTVTASFSLSAVYVLDVPPSTRQADATDMLVFQVESGNWKLVSWKEKQVEPPPAEV